MMDHLLHLGYLVLPILPIGSPDIVTRGAAGMELIDGFRIMGTTLIILMLGTFSPILATWLALAGVSVVWVRTSSTRIIFQTMTSHGNVATSSAAENLPMVYRIALPVPGPLFHSRGPRPHRITISNSRHRAC